MKKRRKRKLNASELKYLIRNYPDTPNEVLAKKLRVSIWTIKSRATKHKLDKSPQFISRLRSDIAVKCDNAARLNTKQAKLKREKTMKQRYGNDTTRIRWGLEPVSKNRHYRREPRARLLQRNRLQRLGYIIDQETLTAYYTNKTHRAVRLEKIQRGTRKGKIMPYYDFKPISEKPEKQ